MAEQLKLLDTWSDGLNSGKVYLEKEIIKPDKIIRHELEICHWDDGTTTERRHKVTHQRFLCVNGPLCGERRIEKEAAAFGYALYNRSCGHGRGRPKNSPPPPPTAVLVHLDSVQVKEEAK